MKALLIIAIDGPAASGKSTASRQVALRLGAVHVDSGALYRGLTWHCLENGVAAGNTAAVLKIMDAVVWSFYLKDHSVRFLLNDKDPGSDIRSKAVGEQVSILAAIPEVRACIVNLLRGMTRFGNLVMEGRDIGTVVFPDANFKFYLDADPLERARRRQQDFTAAAVATSIDGVQSALAQRDARDSTRAVAPLSKAENAYVIDNTCLSADEVTAIIVNTVQKALAGEF